MAVSMYMGEPMNGDIPDIAIDLFDKSMKNFAPSYLTALLNQKVMGRYNDKNAVYEISNNQVTARYSDGTIEILTTTGDNTYTVKGYAADGTLMEQVDTFFDDVTHQIQTKVKTDGSVNGMVPFAEASFEQIAVMLKRHYAGMIDLSEYWNVGDTKKITYNAIPAQNGVTENHPAMSQNITIIGFNHDYITGSGKAAITLQMSNGIGNAGFMNSSATNSGGWRDSKRRAWCNNAFLNALDPALVAMIKSVDKTCDIGNRSNNLVIVSDKVFLLSEIELTGMSELSTTNQGDQYDYYKNSANLKKKQSDVVSGYDNYWTRSAAIDNNKQFVFVESDGDRNTGDASSEYRLLPAFCL